MRCTNPRSETPRLKNGTYVWRVGDTKRSGAGEDVESGDVRGEGVLPCEGTERYFECDDPTAAALDLLS